MHTNRRSFWKCGGTLALAKVSSVNRKHSQACRNHVGYSSISCVSSSEKSLSELSLDEFRLSCSRSAASVAYFCTYSTQQKQQHIVNMGLFIKDICMKGVGSRAGSDRLSKVNVQPNIIIGHNEHGIIHQGYPHEGCEVGQVAD